MQTVLHNVTLQNKFEVDIAFVFFILRAALMVLVRYWADGSWILRPGHETRTRRGDHLFPLYILQ